MFEVDGGGGHWWGRQPRVGTRAWEGGAAEKRLLRQCAGSEANKRNLLVKTRCPVMDTAEGEGPS